MYNIYTCIYICAYLYDEYFKGNTGYNRNGKPNTIKSQEGPS